MNVKQLKQMFQKSGTIKTGLESQPKQRQSTNKNEIERPPSFQQTIIHPDSKPISFLIPKNEKDINAENFKKQLNDRLSRKSSNLESNVSKTEQKSLVVNKKEQIDINLNQILSRVSQSNQFNSSMSVRYGINENYRTRTQQELIFNGLHEQNIILQTKSIPITVQKVSQEYTSADFSKKIQQIAEKQLNSVTNKKQIVLLNSSKTKILDRVNYILNFIFEGGQVQNITGKSRQSYSSIKSTFLTKEIVEGQSPRRSNHLDEIIVVDQSRKQVELNHSFHIKKNIPIQIDKPKNEERTDNVNNNQSATSAIKEKSEQTVHCEGGDLQQIGKKKPKKFQNFDDL